MEIPVKVHIIEVISYKGRMQLERRLGFTTTSIEELHMCKNLHRRMNDLWSHTKPAPIFH